MFFRSPIRKFSSHALSARANAAANILRVSGLDHDGCFGVPNLPLSQVISWHQHVIDELKMQRTKSPVQYAFDYVTSFSNRQSIDIDCKNAIHNQNGLAFPIAAAVAKSLGAHFDPLLLADITTKKLPGFTVSQVKSSLAAMGVNPLTEYVGDDSLMDLMKQSNPGYCFSIDKINIAYAQMHRIAMMHPDYVIDFNIYDDLLEDVLLPLGSFYQKYPELMPFNLKLTLHHYDSASALEYYRYHQAYPVVTTEIAGRGQIDTGYYSTVNAMTDVAIREEGVKPVYNLAACLTPANIQASRLMRESNNDLLRCASFHA